MNLFIFYKKYQAELGVEEFTARYGIDWLGDVWKWSDRFNLWVFFNETHRKGIEPII